MNDILRLGEGNRGGSSSLVGDGEDKGLRCGVHSQESSALRAQHGILLALLLALVICGRLPRNDAK